MPGHWTYAECPADADLMQGDILLPKTGLRTLLEQIHPHFCDPKYLGFSVMTQSCDLVRRKTRCSARYINLAAIRALEDVLIPLLNTVCTGAMEGVYFNESRREGEMLLERIFNQNEHGAGLFYLHPDAESGVAVPSVVLLRVSVAFRTDHYEIFLDSRRGRLREEFRDRFGWLAGNLFARVATQDWHESDERKQELRKLIRDHLEPAEGTTRPLWVKRSSFDAAKAAGEDLEALPRGDLEQALSRHTPPTPREEIIDRAVQTVKKMIPWLCFEDLRKISNRLANDPAIAAALRRARRE